MRRQSAVIRLYHAYIANRSTVHRSRPICRGLKVIIDSCICRTCRDKMLTITEFLYRPRRREPITGLAHPTCPLPGGGWPKPKLRISGRRRIPVPISFIDVSNKDVVGHD